MELFIIYFEILEVFMRQGALDLQYSYCIQAKILQAVLGINYIYLRTLVAFVGFFFPSDFKTFYLFTKLGHKWQMLPLIPFSIGPFTLAKTKIQKTWVFCCTVYTAWKTHNIRGFWHKKRMREKTRISYWCFGKWCACATSLYLWPYTCSAHYVAGRGRVIPLKVMYHVTKNPNNTGEIGASVYIGKKPVKFQRSFKKSRCGGGFFDSGFLECLGEVA